MGAKIFKTEKYLRYKNISGPPVAHFPPISLGAAIAAVRSQPSDLLRDNYNPSSQQNHQQQRDIFSEISDNSSEYIGQQPQQQLINNNNNYFNQSITPTFSPNVEKQEQQQQQQLSNSSLYNHPTFSATYLEHLRGSGAESEPEPEETSEGVTIYFYRVN